MKPRAVEIFALAVFLSSGISTAASTGLHEVEVERLTQKLFPVLAALDDDSSTKADLDAEPKLHKLLKGRSTGVDRAVADCSIDTTCINLAFRFDATDRAAALSGLEIVYHQHSSVRSLVDTIVCKSDAFPLYKSLGCERAFLQVVDNEITSINNIIDTFGDGKSASQDPVDTAEYDTQSSDYRQTLNTLGHDVLEASDQSSPLFQQPVLYACYLLVANRSDYAIRFPGLDTVENAGTVAALKEIQWSNYPYSAILVPGLGPEIGGVPLSPGGRARLRIAVRRYRDGKAPVILVSGGFVHPPHTASNEAVEMRRVLVEEFGVPSNAILIEPFARHTTTNLRDAARLLVRYGISLDKPILITTDVAQTSSINSAQFSDRCLHVFGYLPFRNMEKLSPTDTSLRLTYDSLQLDPRAPLDP